MKLLRSIRFASILFVVGAALSTSHAQTLYTWLGASNALDVDTNWSPTGLPSSFSDDSALFNASATVKTGLATNGPFAVVGLSFTGATFSFAAPGGGDSVSLGNGTTGSLSLASAASVNFSEQTVQFNNPMTISITGNSSLSGVVGTATNLALNVAFGAAQLNIARFSSLDLGSSGTLVVNNWGGTAGVYSGSNNQLRFTVDPTVLLPKISFTGYTGPVSTQLISGYYEVIPVPEPSTYALLGLALAGCIAFRRRRRAA